MNEKIAALLNDQINKEFYSAYLYLDMANYYDELDLDGYANYYMVQAQEERDPVLPGLAPCSNWHSRPDPARHNSFPCPNINMRCKILY